jgi:tetratricopeptide (TPR) repeat protein
VRSRASRTAALNGTVGAGRPSRCSGRRSRSARRRLGRDHRDVAPWINSLAILLNETGGDAEARALYREAIAISVKTLRAEHPEVVRTYNNLARSLRSTGEFAEAEQFARDAIAIWRTALGRDHPLLGRGQDNLARIMLKRAATTTL